MTIIMWLLMLGLLLMVLGVLEAFFREPINDKIEFKESTPALLDLAFKTDRMYNRSERTVKRLLKETGRDNMVEYYMEFFLEILNMPTTDGYTLCGYITDNHNGTCVIDIEVTGSTGVCVAKHYCVTYLHLYSITDVFSNAMLDRVTPIK